MELKEAETVRTCFELVHTGAASSFIRLRWLCQHCSDGLCRRLIATTFPEDALLLIPSVPASEFTSFRSKCCRCIKRELDEALSGYFSKGNSEIDFRVLIQELEKDGQRRSAEQYRLFAGGLARFEPFIKPGTNRTYLRPRRVDYQQGNRMCDATLIPISLPSNQSLNSIFCCYSAQRPCSKIAV